MEAFLNLAKQYFGTRWEVVEFGNMETAVAVGKILLGVLAAKIVFNLVWREMRRRKPNVRTGSGYFFGRHLMPFSRLSRFAVVVLMAAGIFNILFALADPLTVDSEEREIILSRERVEVLDVSGSMAFDYRKSERSAGEVLRKHHLRFLDMRRGKNDRVSLWLFSDTAFKMEDFIIDDDVYYMQVWNAPYSVGKFSPPSASNMFSPDDKFYYIHGEGGTDIPNALRAALDYIYEESDPKVKRKAILMLTDAASYSLPWAELEEIRRKKIALYVIWIMQDDIYYQEYIQDFSNARALIEALPRYGGKYFIADDERSLQKIFDEIDRLEAVEIEQIRYGLETLMFQIPLAVGLICLVAAAALAIFTEIVDPARP